MLYKTTDKTEATEIVIIDSQIDYRGKLDTSPLNGAAVEKLSAML